VLSLIRIDRPASDAVMKELRSVEGVRQVQMVVL
jgi:hypothetical protein